VRLRFTKLDDARHALEVEVAGHTQRAELETRSTLVHDLTHLALESSAAIDDGFFVALARGASLAELAATAMQAESAARMQVERTVAVLQVLARVDHDPAELHGRITSSLALQEQLPPPWFTVEMVASARQRLRALVGRWRATPCGASMEVGWPCSPGGT